MANKNWIGMIFIYSEIEFGQSIDSTAIAKQGALARQYLQFVYNLLQ
ncbi:hypothetical protein [Pedobacter foliorum]